MSNKRIDFRGVRARYELSGGLHVRISMNDKKIFHDCVCLFACPFLTTERTVRNFVLVMF